MKFPYLPYWFVYLWLGILVIGSESLISLTNSNLVIHSQVLGLNTNLGSSNDIYQEIVFWERLLAYQNTYVPAHLELAILYADIGQVDQARKHLGTAKLLDPSNPQLALIERIL